MWPRICEVLLSLWLLFSPAVLRGSPSEAWIARVAAVLMLTFSLISLVERFRRAYLCTLLISLLIAAYPLTQPYPASPLLQNLMLTGLVIAMFAIVPPEAMQPPRPWRDLEHE